MLALSTASASPEQNASFTITETLVVANQSVYGYPLLSMEILSRGQMSGTTTTMYI